MKDLDHDHACDDPERCEQLDALHLAVARLQAKAAQLALAAAQFGGALTYAGDEEMVSERLKEVTDRYSHFQLAFQDVVETAVPLMPAEEREVLEKGVPVLMRRVEQLKGEIESELGEIVDRNAQDKN